MISIVVPTLNEAAALPGLLARLAAEATPHEVIVSDGGSRDASQTIAVGASVRLVGGSAGRGQQLARGAAEARGEVILFLHADTSFPAGGLAAIAAALSADPAALGGNFRLLFDGKDGFSRWVERLYAALRRRGFYYGDSGIFLRRDVLARIGGVRPIALMEDLDLVRRLEAAGRTICIEEPPLVTSSRRFAGRSPVAIVLGWLRLHLLHFAGASPDRLARIYGAGRGNAS